MIRGSQIRDTTAIILPKKEEKALEISEKTQIPKPDDAKTEPGKEIADISQFSGYCINTTNLISADNIYAG